MLLSSNEDNYSDESSTPTPSEEDYRVRLLTRTMIARTATMPETPPDGRTTTRGTSSIQKSGPTLLLKTGRKTQILSGDAGAGPNPPAQERQEPPRSTTAGISRTSRGAGAARPARGCKALVSSSSSSKNRSLALLEPVDVPPAEDELLVVGSSLLSRAPRPPLPPSLEGSSSASSEEEPLFGQNLKPAVRILKKSATGVVFQRCSRSASARRCTSSSRGPRAGGDLPRSRSSFAIMYIPGVAVFVCVVIGLGILVAWQRTPTRKSETSSALVGEALLALPGEEEDTSRGVSFLGIVGVSAAPSLPKNDNSSSMSRGQTIVQAGHLRFNPKLGYHVVHPAYTTAYESSSEDRASPPDPADVDEGWTSSSSSPVTSPPERDLPTVASGVRPFEQDSALSHCLASREETMVHDYVASVSRQLEQNAAEFRNKVSGRGSSSTSEIGGSGESLMGRPRRRSAPRGDDPSWDDLEDHTFVDPMAVTDLHKKS